MGGAYEFACRSAACRPPTSGGTGGSSKSKGGRTAEGKPDRSYQNDPAFKSRIRDITSATRAGSFESTIEARQEAILAKVRAGAGKGASATSGDRFDQEVELEQSLRAKTQTQTVTHTSPHNMNRTAEAVGVMSETDARKLITDNDATGRRILEKGREVQDGDVVGVRANLNVKKTTGLTVQTIHQGTEGQLEKGTGMFSGEAIGYRAAVTLRNVNFSVNQEARAKILSKETNKFPMASVDGRYVDPAGMKYGTDTQRFNGVEITFNPMKTHLFVDPDGRAVKSASEVTVTGSKTYARGTIQYYSEADMPKPARGLPSEAHP